MRQVVLIGIFDALNRHDPRRGSLSTTVVMAVRAVISAQLMPAGWPVRVPRYARAARSRAGRGLPHQHYDGRAIDSALAVQADFEIAAESAVSPEGDFTESIALADELARFRADVEAELRRRPGSGLSPYRAEVFDLDSEVFARRYGLLGHERASVDQVAEEMDLARRRVKDSVTRVMARLRVALKGRWGRD